MNLHELRPLVEIMAAERTTSTPHLFADAVQEGLIAAWKATEGRMDAPKCYVVGAARNGVRSVVRRRPMTGQPRHRGRRWDDALNYSAEIMTATEDDDLTGAKAAHLEDRVMSDRMGRPELHQVWGAVKRLPEQEAHIATLRAYGFDWKQIGPCVGLKEEAARRRFVHHIAPRLAADLDHLRGVA